MDIRKILILAFSLMLFGCAATGDNAKKAAASAPDFSKAVPPVELMPPPPPVIKKDVIKRDPLADIFVSIDAVEETLSSILYMIASEAGLNLIISPDINVKTPFTITVNHMPARDALEIISENTGIHYEVSGNALKIVSTVTKTFKFPYVRMQTTQSSQVGGDVFGSTEANLRGDYSIKYENTPEANDVLGQIEFDIQAIIGGGGASASADAATTTESASGSFFNGKEGYVFNKFTGVMKVTTTPAKMKMIDSYMSDVLSEMGKQVLIEAKLVEVILNDSSAYGINWQGALNGTVGRISLGAANFANGSLDALGVISSGTGDDWFAFMATQGRIESVGNPRIRVMNGQTAMISSGQLIPYWEMEKETDEETDDVTITYTRVTVLDGVVMGVSAHIKEDDTITLNIVPVFSDVETVKTQLDTDGVIAASYPIINLKEAGTVLNVKSGSTIVMGGLISNVEVESEEKVPFFGDVPVIGHLFKGTTKSVEKRELVIFLTTTIIDGKDGKL
ncbi:MAG: hypothetical protein AB7E76_06110 [Deferribacterales bacterium]